MGTLRWDTEGIVQGCWQCGVDVLAAVGFDGVSLFVGLLACRFGKRDLRRASRCSDRGERSEVVFECKIY